MAAPAYKDSGIRMTEAQRRCLLHVLRNMTTAFTGALSLLENPRQTPTAEELFRCLKATPVTLDRVLSALEAGNFCTLTEEQCEFAGKHMGCRK